MSMVRSMIARATSADVYSCAKARARSLSSASSALTPNNTMVMPVAWWISSRLIRRRAATLRRLRSVQKRGRGRWRPGWGVGDQQRGAKACAAHAARGVPAQVKGAQGARTGLW